MYGRYRKHGWTSLGIVANVKKVGRPDILSTHCILREQLASKKMSPELLEVLLDVIKIVNLI